MSHDDAAQMTGWTQATTLRSRDHLFYSTMALAMAAVVFVGFGPSYYWRLVDGGPTTTVSGGPFTVLVHLHAVAFSSWMLLFVAQTMLAATRRVAVHRRVGVGGAVLAVVMVLSGTMSALGQAARGAAPSGRDPIEFLAVPLADMALFLAYVALAVLMRTRPETHKRLMVLASSAIIAAAFGRIPAITSLAPTAAFFASTVFLFAGVSYDLLSRRRVHPVYLWGGMLLVASGPARIALSRTAVWREAMEVLLR